MSNVKNVIALTQETVANSTTGDVNTDDNTLFVDKSANRVGIQTNTPDAALDVTDSTSGNGSGIHINTGSRSASDDGHVLINGRAKYGYEDGIITISDKNENGASSNKHFKINLSNSDRFYINYSTGSIGIGTTAGLSNTLNVEGTGRFTGNVTASYYHGDGSQLTGISAGATGGGTDQVFFLSDQNVTVDYTIPTGRNALSAGPLTVNTGVTVTIPSGSAWTIV